MRNHYSAPIKRYAWRPRIVETWRPINPTRALIWMQSYYEKGDEVYCLRLGLLSWEFPGSLLRAMIPTFYRWFE